MRATVTDGGNLGEHLKAYNEGRIGYEEFTLGTSPT
jgi:hypothetical protein